MYVALLSLCFQDLRIYKIAHNLVLNNERKKQPVLLNEKVNQAGIFDRAVARRNCMRRTGESQGESCVLVVIGIFRWY